MLSALLATLLHAMPCSAQADHIPSDAPEAWAMFWFASATSFSRPGVPHHREAWSVELFGDLALLPHLDKDRRTVGFDGTKVEDLNKSPLSGRIGLMVALPWSLAFSVGYLPPVEMFGVRANLVSLSLERPLLERGPWTLGARLHTQLGNVRGDFTCPSQVLRFAPGSEGNPYGCESESRDKAIQRSLGLDLAASYRVDALAGLAPYLVLGGNYLDTEFEVHARTFGFDDRTHLASDTFTFSVGAGATMPLGKRAIVGIGLYYVPLWVTRPPETSDENDELLQARATISIRLR